MSKSPDVAWAKAVKERDHWRCRRCGRGPTKELHAHHIFTRSRASTAHDLENGISLCPGCHSWAHAEPTEFHYWIKTELGTVLLEAVQARSREMLKDEIDHERERVLESQFEERREARR